MKRLPAPAIALLLISVGALLFSLVFAYRWYDGHQAADRIWKDGQCLNASIARVNDGKYCPAAARLKRENADRDLRFALVGLGVFVIAGGAGLVLSKNTKDAKPQYPDERVPSTRNDRRGLSNADLPDQLRQLSDLHESGGLSDAEFQEAKRKLLE